MKKLFILALAAILTISCVDQKINGIPLEEGDTMTYETKDYLIIYKISGFDNFGQAIWEFEKIINKKDSL